MEINEDKALCCIRQMMERNNQSLLSSTAISNLFTMGVTSRIDARQLVPDKPQIPDEPTRLLRARLIMEEALETIEGLGVGLALRSCGGDHTKEPTLFGPIFFSDLELVASPTVQPNLEKIVDGCCDLNYVSIGTLCACGVPDIHHQEKVDLANNAKFPGGKATVNENGKYQKPPGWTPPDHKSIMNGQTTSLKEITQLLLRLAQNDPAPTSSEKPDAAG